MKSKTILPIIFLFIITVPLSAPALLSDTHFGGDKATDPSPAVVKIYFDNFSQLNQLAGRYDIWEVDHTAGYLLAYLTPQELKDLSSSGLQFEIDQNFNERIHRRSQLLPNQESGIPGFPCYRTVEETHAVLADLSIAYPQLATFVDIGDSWEKTDSGGASGYDLHSLVITNKNTAGPKPKFYLIAAVHAREYATAELATRFAEYLLTNYDLDPDVTWLLDYFEVHITPYGNPDGRKIAENGIYWRKNTDNDDGCSEVSFWGTDLNRNSSFKWGGTGASPDACSETYRGVSAASEPETRAIQNYAAALFPDMRGPGDSDPAPNNTEGVFITLHSYGELVLYPWGWSSNSTPNDKAYETLARKFGFFTGYQVCQSGGVGCLYQTSGSNDDWVYGELGVASFTIELGTNFFESCSYFEDSILEDNLDALMYTFKAARRPYQNPYGPDSINITLSAEQIAPGASLSLTVFADDTRFDSGGWGSEPVQPIQAGRYSIDQPSWSAEAQIYSLSPLDGSFDNPIEYLTANVDTSSLTPGRHTTFIESQDADGNWGVPGAIFFWITTENFQPVLSPNEVQGSGTPGTQVHYRIKLTNGGTMDDSYDLQVTGNSWEIASITGSLGSFAPMESQEISITFKIPESGLIGDHDLANFKVVSKSDPNKFAHTQIRTTIRQPELYLPTISR